MTLSPQNEDPCARPSPVFDPSFIASLETLIAWRRDVRRFKREPIHEHVVEHLLDVAQMAPSVGNSQPWRWVRVKSDTARMEVLRCFERCNSAALTGYDGDKARLYANLKLAGISDAPVQFAVYCDKETPQGHGLGVSTMPEAKDYSVVASIATMALAARAHGIGTGWVSIIDPAEVAGILRVPDTWRLIAYLCVGWPEEESVTPELEKAGWQMRTSVGRTVFER